MRVWLVAFVVRSVSSCSNILVTKGASSDGYVHTSYNADDAALFGAVPRWGAALHPPGSVREVWSWDLGIKLGEVPEPPQTYNVMGNANEFGVVIGETTHGGLSVLSNAGKTEANGTRIDYGSLIWMTLQRARSAREAVSTMVDLATTYGYASSMEGFSIADADEVWYMEMLGRGNLGEGVLYVALRIPEGYVVAHANQARIREFLPCDDPEWCRYSPDVVEFATKNGFYDGTVPFSFSDVFDPVTFEGARFCEARVWYVFSHLGKDFNATYYLPYARGDDLARRMPLWVEASNVSARDVRALMASHYEGSWFDPSVDVGAGPEHSPYRYNGLEWTLKNQTFVNERPVGTQYTGWHFVSTIRADVPPPMKALLWWGADDHSWSPAIPIHGGATEVHPSYDGQDCAGRSECRRARGLPGTVTDFDVEAAWWVNNLVADTVYTRYDRAAPVVEAAMARLEATLSAKLEVAEDEASRLEEEGLRSEALQVLSRHAVEAGAVATQTWTALWQRLVVLFIDGKITKPDPTDGVCGCVKDSAEFSNEWKQKVVDDTGNKYEEPPTQDPMLRAAKGLRRRASRRPIHKLDIKGVAGATRSTIQ
ncbi:hypothetical protein CTAYLR_001808 [Chrysophaeum taylorii]|uniref:Dipeptidase n=1 Tax=Chrysophaeum taylorii TaxID=2483200 RepID=A0AAD7XJ24_9STRA|nr:hypothetical protein CTAYLR_001808 [Chrysophaeum taylorii]